MPVIQPPLKSMLAISCILLHCVFFKIKLYLYWIINTKSNYLLYFYQTRGVGAKRKDLKPITIELEHGSLLMMNYPTNQFWYHSLPKRKRAPGVRINMTFRKMVVNSTDKRWFFYKSKAWRVMKGHAGQIYVKNLWGFFPLWDKSTTIVFF